MTGNGIMQDIRGLLSHEMSAAEIISEGYAPSTVYRVQREVRRKSGLYRSVGSGHRESTWGLEYSARLERDIGRLQGQLAAMESRLAELEEAEPVDPLWDQVAEFQRSLAEVQTRQEKIVQEMHAEKAMIGKIDSELDALAKVFENDSWTGNPKWQRLSE